MEKAGKFRHERKFLLNGISFSEVLLKCKLHPALFQVLYAPRKINNIYFDTPGFSQFLANIEGERDRVKYRIRWYGKLFKHIKRPVLEMKVKQGALGTKISYPLPAFTLNHMFSRDSFFEMVAQSGLPEQVRHDLLALEPVLLNSYYRHYFLSFNKKFRLTIDQKLKFYRISYHNPVSMESSENLDTIVVELKYPAEEDQTAREVTSLFPFALTKSSKYTQGIERLFQ